MTFSSRDFRFHSQDSCVIRWLVMNQCRTCLAEIWFDWDEGDCCEEMVCCIGFMLLCALCLCGCGRTTSVAGTAIGELYRQSSGRARKAPTRSGESHPYYLCRSGKQRCA